MGVGDVGPIHEPIGTYSELVREAFRNGDICFAQCERTYSTRGSLQVGSNGHNSRQPPPMAQVFSDAGFNVVSVASNHAMDWGAESLLDTIELFNSRGIQTIGAGADIDHARSPARFDVRGVRVGMLGYGSVLREGYWATEHQAGVAPVRAHTYYEAQEYQAGTPPRVITVPFAEDIAAMVDDITALRADVDVVIVSFHWGVHHIPKVLADYQRSVARAVFAAGGDLIVGHHAHVPKAIEVIDGKVCFHSLANFMFTTSEKGKDKPGHRFSSGSKYQIPLDPAYPRLPFGRDGQRSLIAMADLTAGGVQRVSFVPVQIDTQYRPEILRPPDPRFDEAVRYLDDVSSEVEHTFTLDGDEVVVS
jgi:poly-gamma-glutamate synthesis protein (capsule biosynthesis protein)